jgi:hypothetical protein
LNEVSWMLKYLSKMEYWWMIKFWKIISQFIAEKRTMLFRKAFQLSQLKFFGTLYWSSITHLRSFLLYILSWVKIDFKAIYFSFQLFLCLRQLFNSQGTHPLLSKTYHKDYQTLSWYFSKVFFFFTPIFSWHWLFADDFSETLN